MALHSLRDQKDSPELIIWNSQPRNSFWQMVRDVPGIPAETERN
jgi:hypothetical protein